MHALPVPLTSFIGRDGDLAAVCDLLGQHRLVTLIGSGGCGKTRLAVEVARRVVPRFEDGLVIAELAPVESGTLVPSVVAAAAGVPEAGGATVLMLLRNGLAARDLLLILDNCEHLVDACAEVVGDLLVHCPNLTVLATSRTPLGVDGEVTWRVPSLSLPPADAPDALTEIEDSESGRLLLDRARLARPDFTITEDEGAEVIAICRQLDGIPLAIELAAGRLRALGIKDLAAGLEHRFNLLSAGSRMAPPRQRTLEASIDWSYGLLDERERTLLRRLSVFAGSFTIDAVERVCTDEIVATPDVRALLAQLVDHSLVQLDEGPFPRYRLLESVHAYARTRLREAEEESQYRDRHLGHVCEITAWYDTVSEDAELEAHSNRIEPILDEVRSALEWCLRSVRMEDGLGIAADLRLFWLSRDRNQEGRSWLAAMLQAEELHRSSDGGFSRARAQLAAAQLSLFANDPISQELLAAAALPTVQDHGDRELEARALVLVGWAKVFTDPVGARPLLDTAYEIAQEIDDVARIEFASFGLGTGALLAGDLETAERVLASGVHIAQQRNSVGVAFGIGAFGYVRTLSGQPAQAVRAIEDVIATYGDFNQTHRDLAATMYALALAYLGRWEEACHRPTETIERSVSVGSPALYAQIHLALLERAVGDLQACRALVHQFQGLLEVPGFAWYRTQALTWLGDVAAVEGDLKAAQDHWREAMSVAERSENPLARSVANLGLARGAVLAANLDGARSLARDALRHARDAGYGIGAIDAVEALSLLPDPDQAVLLAAVDAERSRTGYVRFPIDEPAYRAAVAEVGQLPDDAVPFDDAVGLALGDHSRTARPASGWGSLTPAELRVAQLVAQGMTNPQVGEQLFISPRTVQAHLSRIYTKLDVSNRAELATVVTRNEPVS